MSNAAAKLGWVIFATALAGAVLHRGSDTDAPLDTALKSAGLYQAFFLMAGIVIVLALVYMAFTIRKAMTAQRQLDEFRGRKGKG